MTGRQLKPDHVEETVCMRSVFDPRRERVGDRNGDPSSDPNAVERSITRRHSASGAEAAKSKNESRSTQDGIECYNGERLTKPLLYR